MMMEDEFLVLARLAELFEENDTNQTHSREPLIRALETLSGNLEGLYRHTEWHRSKDPGTIRRTRICWALRTKHYPILLRLLHDLNTCLDLDDNPLDPEAWLQAGIQVSICQINDAVNQMVPILAYDWDSPKSEECQENLEDLRPQRFFEMITAYSYILHCMAKSLKSYAEVFKSTSETGNQDEDPTCGVREPDMYALTRISAEIDWLGRSELGKTQLKWEENVSDAHELLRDLKILANSTGIKYNPEKKVIAVQTAALVTIVEFHRSLLVEFCRLPNSGLFATMDYKNLDLLLKESDAIIENLNAITETIDKPRPHERNLTDGLDMLGDVVTLINKTLNKYFEFSADRNSTPDTIQYFREWFQVWHSQYDRAVANFRRVSHDQMEDDYMMTSKEDWRFRLMH